MGIHFSGCEQAPTDVIVYYHSLTFRPENLAHKEQIDVLARRKIQLQPFGRLGF